MKNVISHSLYKVDIETQQITLQKFDENENVNNYVSDLLESVKDNEGDREYEFEAGSLTMKTLLNNIITNKKVKETCKLIATRLLEKETEAQKEIEHLDKKIQKGILIISYLQMTDNERKIIISKADYTEFIEEISGVKRNGLPTKKKIFKSFIANVNNNKINKLVTYDSNSSKAAYWTKKFLELKEIRNDEDNTLIAYNTIKKKILDPIRSKHKQDWLCLSNATIAYFRGEGEFDLNHYRDNIVGNYQPIDDTLKIKELTTKITNLPTQDKFDVKFNKVPKIVKDKFKNTINLTPEIDLVIKHDIPNLKRTFKPYEVEGKHYIAILSEEGYKYAQKNQDEQ
jgi:hypothetical protein